MFFGKKLKEEREKKGWSQSYLAEKIPVSHQAVSKWETNDYNPDIEVITRLSDIFNIEIDELLMNEKIIQNNKKYLDWQSFFYLILTGLIGFLIGFFIKYQETSMIFISKTIGVIFLIFLVYMFLIKEIKDYKNKSSYFRFAYLVITSHITAIISGIIFFQFIFIPSTSYLELCLKSRPFVVVMIFSFLVIALFVIMYLTFHITSDFLIKKSEMKYIIKRVKDKILFIFSLFSIIITFATFALNTMVGSSIDFEVNFNEELISFKIISLVPLYFFLSIVIYIMFKNNKDKQNYM